jgi:hypothetical protein
MEASPVPPDFVADLKEGSKRIFFATSIDLAILTSRHRCLIVVRTSPLAIQRVRTLSALGVKVEIDPTPCELPDPIRCDLDTVPTSYKNAVTRFWRVLSVADTLLKRLSTNFYGKISPVHFFWGSFDLAATRFNGRKAPHRPGADSIPAEAYSHEVISTGFWPGDGGYGRAAFYSYAAPTPKGLNQTVLRGLGRFNQQMGEFLLDYSQVREQPDPVKVVMTFLQETYSAAARLAKWNRATLDRDSVTPAALGGK